MCNCGGGVCVCMELGVFIAIALDETSILGAVNEKHLLVMLSGPSCEVEERRRQPITFVVY